MDERTPTDAERHDQQGEADSAEKVYWRFLIVLQVVMAAEFVLLMLEQQWLNGLLVVGVMALTLAPAFLFPRISRVRIPAEFQLMAVAFVFASLFLGETLSYYERFAWWDTALHFSSGLLLAVFGFLLAYVLNEDERIELHLNPSFVALFAFLFAVAGGAVWEIFEFSMDGVFGTSMQSGGLRDTMWDLIFDTISAAAISIYGWWHLRRTEHSFIEKWVLKFVRRNPRLFRRKRRRSNR